MKKRRLLVLLLPLLLVGCLHKSGNLPISPWERVMVNNASFAQINNDAELGTESLVSTGMLTAEQAKPYIKWESQIASDHKQVTAVLKQGPGVTASNIASVNQFLDQVQQSGNDLIKSGGLGVKNPQTQQTVTMDVQALVNLAKVLLNDIALAKGGQ